MNFKYNINLNSYDVVKAVLFQPNTSIKIEGNTHGSFPTPMFSTLLRSRMLS